MEYETSLPAIGNIMGNEHVSSAPDAPYCFAPDTAGDRYGYIRVGASIGPGIFAIDKFVEKPDAKIAEHYVSEGYLWNSGNFMFAPDCFSTTTNDLNRTVVVRGSPRVTIRAQTKTSCENQSM
jgi:mannose-1-phosphate guanylyltransferase